MKKNICNVCNEHHYCDKHHIQSKCYGGTNIKANTAKLCTLCHRLVHVGDIIIEKQVLSSTGKILIHRQRGEQSITGMPDPNVWLYTDKHQGNGGDKIVQEISDKSTDECVHEDLPNG